MKSVALLKAIRLAGSVTKLAEALGVAPQAISQWRKAPIVRVLEIERITGVSRQELRPDIYPPTEPPTAPKAAFKPASRAKTKSPGAAFAKLAPKAKREPEQSAEPSPRQDQAA